MQYIFLSKPETFSAVKELCIQACTHLDGDLVRDVVSRRQSRVLMLEPFALV